MLTMTTADMHNQGSVPNTGTLELMDLKVIAVLCTAATGTDDVGATAQGSSQRPINTVTASNADTSHGYTLMSQEKQRWQHNQPAINPSSPASRATLSKPALSSYLDGEVRAISASHVGSPSMSTPRSPVVHLLAEAGEGVQAYVSFQPNISSFASISA